MKELKKAGGDWQRYFFIARDNILYLLSNYWDNVVGAMLNPGHDTPKHIHNMNNVMITALVALAETEGDEN